MIWIVSGPTSVGKSTFMASQRAVEITGLDGDIPVVFPSAVETAPDLEPPDWFLHYNIFRPLQQRRVMERRARIADSSIDAEFQGFADDESWTRLTGVAGEKRAVVLVASKETLLSRIADRRQIEDGELIESGAKDYPNRRWRTLLQQIDLADWYRVWLDELRARHIPYVLVNSEDPAYSIIADESDIAAIANSAPATLPGERTVSGARIYSKEEIEAILAEGRFGYHRIELPYGLHTRGQDRSETRDLVLPASLAGKSVLDVGSAHGYFCFEAEARGAARVVGVEPRTDRFDSALLLKEIKGSNVEFQQRDILASPTDETFDLVLLLNVTHHLSEPIQAIRHLAAITREQLVIEFPTLEDRKFKKSLDAPLPPGSNALPLIGVSSMRPGIGQTFLFTAEAMRRILTDHAKVFAAVEIIDSPMPGRAIAYCFKTAPDDSSGQPAENASLSDEPAPSERRRGRGDGDRGRSREAGARRGRRDQRAAASDDEDSE